MEVMCYLKSRNIDQTYRDEADQLKNHKQNQDENELGLWTFLIELRKKLRNHLFSSEGEIGFSLTGNTTLLVES